MNLQALSGAVANAVVAALNSSHSLQPNQTDVSRAHTNPTVSPTNQPQPNQVLASQPLLQAQGSIAQSQPKPKQSTSSGSQNRAAQVGSQIAGPSRNSGAGPSRTSGAGPSRNSGAGPSRSSVVQCHAAKMGSESTGPSRSSYREYCEMINLSESDSDYEDLQAAIEASFNEAAQKKQDRAIPPLCLLSTGTPVKEILKRHSEDVVTGGDDDTYQRINIRRSNLFDDTLTQMRKSSFSFAKPFSVRFLGEAAVDTGGPKRELFRLFLEEMKTRASLFHCSPVGLLPSHNVTALGSSDYFVIGTILAASILLGGPPPVCFTPAVADVLVYGDVMRTPSVDSISDPSITDKLSKVLSATSDAELQERFQSLDYSFRFDCGYSKPVSSITLETRTEFVRCISLHFLYSIYAEINQLRNGLLETLSFKKLADEHPMELWSLLAASKAETSTAVQMQDLFQVHYSPRGSNNRVLEENVIMHMYDFLQECEDSPESTEVSLGDFLAFVSGVNQPPAIGFANTPSIHFTGDNRLPFVSTCAVTITLPRNIQTYQVFKETLQLAVLGSHGFGNV